MIRAHFRVDGIDFPQFALVNPGQELPHGGVIAVHIAHLHHQPFCLRALQHGAKFLQRATAGLVQVDMLARVYTEAGAAGKIRHRALHRHRVAFFQKLAGAHARQIAVARPAAPQIPPDCVLFRVAYYLEAFRKLAKRLHFARSMVVTDAQLSNSNLAHGVSPPKYRVFPGSGPDRG